MRKELMAIISGLGVEVVFLVLSIQFKEMPMLIAIIAYIVGGILILYGIVCRLVPIRKIWDILMSIRFRSPLFRKAHQLNEGNNDKGNRLCTRQEIEILGQVDYDKYHLKDRMIIRDGGISSWKLDPVMGGELGFSFEVFNGSVFPSVKIGHTIEGKLILQGKEFHDKPEIKLPQDCVHGNWVTISIIQPILPEVIREIKEGATNQGGIVLCFDFQSIKIYAEAEKSNTGLPPQNTLNLSQTLKYRVKHEADIYSWQRLYDVNIS